MTIKNYEFELSNMSSYEYVNKEQLKDINSDGYILKHKKTGARIALVANDDENKVFCIGFRTPPSNSTGVPHIIEHSVLCGSREFPLKDTFIELAKGSLNTFLNAMTYPDKTIYPIASCNDKDFKNLMHVYLDSVFYPNIYKKKEIFMQEGWHYELDSLDGELTYNGVVYNEMKGVFSSAEERLFRSIQNSLFPDNTYGVESGGDPDAIPDLSYEEFLDFHKKYYHPSNSYIILYGDMDFVERLEWLEEHYLKDFDHMEVDSKIQYQKPFKNMKIITEKYSLSENESLEENTYLSYNVAIDKTLDKKIKMAFAILDYVLLSAPGAPVRQALLDAGIGKDVFSSFDGDILQPYLSIISKNAEAIQKDKFIEVIETAFKEQIERGIDEKSLRAAINYYEFKYRESDYGRTPKGLVYGTRMLSTWLYDDSKIFDSLYTDDLFDFLKEKVNTSYYADIIKEYILDNTHETLIVLEPQVGLTAKKEADLKRKLEEYKNSLTVEERQKIISDMEELKKYQEEPSRKEDMEKIPLLSREDIGHEVQEVYNEEIEVDGIPLIHHDVFTNKIAYMKLIFDLESIPKHLMPYAGLLTNVLGYVDTQHYGYLDLSNEVNIHTGGINFDVGPIGKRGSATEYMPTFQVEVKALYDEMDSAFDLLKEIISFTKFDDKKRLKEIVSEIESRMQMYLASSGHSTAMDRATSYFAESARFSEDTKGISFFKFIEELTADFDNQVGFVIEKLRLVMSYIFKKENLIISFTSCKEGLKTLEGKLLPFVEQLKEEELTIEPASYELKMLNEGFKTAGQVQYVARAGNYMKAGLSYTGALEVLKVILSYDYLWNNVRVKGGAYGAMCGFSPISGNSYFVSYRDPNLKETNEIYEKIVGFVEAFDADERELTKYIIGTISNFDVPRTPRMIGNASITAYLTGTTKEDQMKQREEIINVTVEDIRKLAAHIKAILAEGAICVVGSESKIEENKDLFYSVKTLTK